MLLLLLFFNAPQDSPFRWTDVTEKAGLVKPLEGMMGHGGAWGDVDGDGRIDLFVGGFCDRMNGEYAPAPGPVPTRLLRNLGDGRFEPLAAAEHHARTSGAVFADLDNDGDLDLYVANNAQAKTRKTEEPQRGAQLHRSALFRNDAGKLVDVSEASGACPPDLLTARNVLPLDFDGDGLVDLLVLEDLFVRGTKTPRSLLLRNKGDLKFEVANREAGFPDDVHGLGGAAADVNGDRRPDLFISHSNRLFLSAGGTKFVEDPAARAVFSWEPRSKEDWACGASFGDVDGDGDLDLVVSGHHEPARIRLWRNDEGKFTEITKEAGLADLIPVRAPHCEFQDFDNDGRPDLYVSAAWLEDGKVTPLVYRNTGGRFEPPRPIKGPMVYYPAGPSADYDGDGRLDLFLINWFSGRRSVLLRNESPPRRWLDVQVVGRVVNRMGLGSRVRILKDGKLLGVQEISAGYGYASGQRAYAHFGLGDVATVDVEVTLPSGKMLLKEGVAADRLLVVEEPRP